MVLYCGTMETVTAAKVQYSTLQPGDVIARFDTVQILETIHVACGQSFAKLSKRITKGDVVTVDKVTAVEPHGCTKGWQCRVMVVGDPIEYSFSSNMWAARAG